MHQQSILEYHCATPEHKYGSSCHFRGISTILVHKLITVIVKAVPISLRHLIFIYANVMYHPSDPSAATLYKGP